MMAKMEGADINALGAEIELNAMLVDCSVADTKDTLGEGKTR